MSKVYLTCGRSLLIHRSFRVVKVILAISFLSSGATYGNSSSASSVVDAYDHSGNAKFRLPPMPAPTAAHQFDKPYGPVKYLIKWPPVPTKNQMIEKQGYLRIREQMAQQPSVAIEKSVPWWHFFVLLGGVLIVAIVGAWSRIKVFK